MITKIEKYGSEFCGPCKVLDKTLSQINKDTVEIVKFDADENEDLFAEKGIRNVPTMIFYNETGDEVKRVTGSLPLSEILKIING